MARMCDGAFCMWWFCLGLIKAQILYGCSNLLGFENLTGLIPQQHLTKIVTSHKLFFLDNSNNVIILI
jgi:hypothetical protein